MREAGTARSLLCIEQNEKLSGHSFGYSMREENINWNILSQLANYWEFEEER